MKNKLSKIFIIATMLVTVSIANSASTFCYPGGCINLTNTANLSSYLPSFTTSADFANFLSQYIQNTNTLFTLSSAGFTNLTTQITNPNQNTNNCSTQTTSNGQITTVDVGQLLKERGFTGNGPKGEGCNAGYGWYKGVCDVAGLGPAIDYTTQSKWTKRMCQFRDGATQPNWGDPSCSSCGDVLLTVRCGPKTNTTTQCGQCTNGATDYPTCATCPTGQNMSNGQCVGTCDTRNTCTMKNVCGQSINGYMCNGTCTPPPGISNINNSCITNFKVSTDNVNPNGFVDFSWKIADLNPNVTSKCGFVDLTTPTPRPIPGLQNLDPSVDRARINNIQTTTRFCLVCQFINLLTNNEVGNAVVHQWIRVIKIGEY
jgi:hypothetical protein